MVTSDTSSADASGSALDSLRAPDFDLHQETGFLPSQEPVQRLEESVGGGWHRLEEIFAEGQAYAHSLGGAAIGKGTAEWRRAVEELAAPDVAALNTLPLLRRGHVLLSFLSHLYLHSTSPARTVVPGSLAPAWIETSSLLGLPPVLTYADTVLWNWRLIDPSRPISADNVVIATTFTSTYSEYGFFLLSLLCEIHGATILRRMMSILDMVQQDEPRLYPAIASGFVELAGMIVELGDILHSATNGSFGPGGAAQIDPISFYREVRPFFNGGEREFRGCPSSDRGSDQSANSVIVKGGPSAGQSTLIHAIDLFLGIDHTPRTTASGSRTPDSVPPPSSFYAKDLADLSPPPSKKDGLSPSSTPQLSDHDSTFMQRMALYMPAPHRALLEHMSNLQKQTRTLDQSPNGVSAPPRSVRQLMTSPVGRTSSELVKSYDTAVRAMTRFRDMHLRLVSVFIIQPSRLPHPQDSESREEEHEVPCYQPQQALAPSAKEEELVGTGGTALVSFLRASRKRTTEAYMETLNAGRSSSEESEDRLGHS